MVDKTVNSFKGLIPGIDRKRIKEPYVVDGRNFYVTVDGPLSAFSRRIVMNNAIETPEYIESFRVNDDSDSFIFTDTAVLRYDEDANDLIPVLVFSSQAEAAPWSRAYVGGDQFFARKGIGLIRFNASTEEWTEITGVSVPANIFSVTQSGGRLIVLAEGLIAWSAISDGTDLTPSIITGAGAQSLALVNATGPNDPLMVLEYVDGFIAYTKKGSIIAQALSTGNPFRHRVLTRFKEHIPLDAFNIIQFGDYKHLFLTRTGFYTTQGALPEQFQPVFSEYFHTNLLPDLDTSQIGVTRLSYDSTRKWLLVSVGQTSEIGSYDKAFLYYEPIDEWGVFNRIHTGFIDIPTNLGVDVGFTFCYVDVSGTIYKFSDTIKDELFPDAFANPYIYDYRKNVEFPSRYELGEIAFVSHGHMATIDQGDFTDAGIYDLNRVIEEAISPVEQDAEFIASDGNTDPISFKTTGKMSAGLLKLGVAFAEYLEAPLDAYIILGLFSVEKGEDTSELSSIDKLEFGMLDQALIESIVEDWLGDYPTDVFEDWLTAPDEVEDWGSDSTVISDYSVEIIGTLDGYNQWENQSEIPEAFLERGRARFYTCYVVGIHNLIKVDAAELGHNFALKTLGLNLTPNGRLV